MVATLVTQPASTPTLLDSCSLKGATFIESQYRRPASLGGFQNSLVDAHEMERNLEARDDIRFANPFVFQTLYLSTDLDEFDTIVGVGSESQGGSVSFSAGGPIEGGDTHYANGSYDGPMQHEVIIDDRIASRDDLEVGD